MNQRLEWLRDQLDVHGVQSLVLSHRAHVRWACGFSGTNGILVISREKSGLVTDGRYAEQSKEQVSGAEIYIASAKEGLLAMAVEQKLVVGPEVGFQADHLTVARRDQLSSALPGFKLVGVTQLCDRRVAVKSKLEIDAIERALRITEGTFQEILPLVKVGVTEKELAAEIVYRQMRKGAESMPETFDPIVAAGPRAALPHAEASDRKLENGEMVLFDFGCVADGYCSDMTRMASVGDPGQEAKKVYETVLSAKQAATKKAAAGMPACQLDKVARDVITEAGYGEQFVHSLGHAVGLQIHEWPSLSRTNEEPLPEQAVVTIEPGVYLPGKFGVRIEDMILLEEDGCRNLTKAPDELMVV